MPKTLSLYELNQHIRYTLENSLPDTFLVTAEIASCDVKNHCYMTLVDKDEDTIRAEIRAVIWAGKYRAIARQFEKETGAKLAKGIKILFQAEVSFHERYGLKLNITDIDPSYTIGDLAMKRKEILERLAKEGLLERNRKLAFPLVPQRIGIVSSSTAAGYEDLMNHLVNNGYGYRFKTVLYEAVMQGDRAEESIVRALGECAEKASSLDVIVVVRGGGGQVDLHCFDSYPIGRAIALHPLPVISGIGHQRDVTVVDEVSNVRAKTPTAVADLIITKVKEFEDLLDFAANKLVRGSNSLTLDMKERLSSLSRDLEVIAGNKLLDHFHSLRGVIKGLQYSVKVIRNNELKLKTAESSIHHLNPRNVLKRGYSLTYYKGKTVRSAAEVKEGSRLKTVLAEGEIASRVHMQRDRGKTGTKAAGKAVTGANLELFGSDSASQS